MEEEGECAAIPEADKFAKRGEEKPIKRESASTCFASSFLDII